MKKYAAITYELVRRLLHIPAGCDDRWDGDLPCQPPYELRHNGIYARPIDLIDGLSDTEREALEPWFPPESDGDYSLPVCPLPCDLNTFIRFVDGADMWERIVEFVGFYIVDIDERCANCALTVTGTRYTFRKPNPVFRAAIEQYLDEVTEGENPSRHALSGQQGGRKKAGGYTERDALVLELRKTKYKDHPSWASRIQKDLELRGQVITTARIRQIVKKIER